MTDQPTPRAPRHRRPGAGRPRITGLRAVPAIVLLLTVGCGARTTAVGEYLTDAELQCETEAQRRNLHQALTDILELEPDELRARRYADYTGKSGRWDLPTLLQRHFVPARAGLTLGARFYEDLESPGVQRWARETLARIEGAAPRPTPAESDSGSPPGNSTDP